MKENELAIEMRNETRWGRINLGPGSWISIVLLIFGHLLMVVELAGASDGKIEINQACATLTGCFEGDSAGYPVTILASFGGSSFLLTSDLVVPADGFVGGIKILGDTYDVTIDLNGFSIMSADCVGATGDCTPSSFSSDSDGIEQKGSVFFKGYGTTVLNGKIIGFPGSGIDLGESAMVRNIEARWNKVWGVSVRDGSIVVDTRASDNGFSGIRICCEGGGGGGSLIARSAMRSNDFDGLHTASSALVIDSVADSNGVLGFDTGLASLIVGNVARSNGDGGFRMGYSSLVMRNAAYGNIGNGYETYLGEGTNFVRNTAVNNVGIQFLLTPSSGFRECVASNSIIGSSVSGGINLGANACNGNTTCP